MNNRLPSRRRARAATLAGLALASLLLSLGLLAAGCGEGSSDADTTVTTASGQTTATTAAAGTTSGTELGEAVGAAWAEVTQKLNALLAGRPEAGSVQSEVAALKEEYVQKFVAFGEQRLGLDSGAQDDADAALLSALNDAANADWYKTYMRTYEAYAYMSGDVEFTNLLASFNILTQYSDFELLKEQAPDEAARLGIK
ncbi:MAG: hypothetical protein A2133_04755 [Actinobacteria bacterium RBG_16_64_13]|nr:MAG: hypothetical protein A2133_04755 [Actinobacteria bacterium RBG_16_64_13]